ncbi:hypothetical protein [Flavobacterium panici]|uniref:Uncharacterized protein n=1 Tax=Flavobacterium panici TaxID=2654843 RepID=A0A9N8P1T9_9FLAO|nr:hypothetical protein [Flavobacterium panici]CAC9974389.1 hypothetical protein FLAPXU55_02086 [Flavobacterium panici]
MKENRIAQIKNELQQTEKNEGIITVKLIQQESPKSSVFEKPFAKDLGFPLILAVLLVLITRFITRKTIKAEISKLKTETDKNNAEIAKVKSSYQPIILNSLQIIQSHLYQDKINSLKNLMKSKSDLFNVKQIYHEGDALIDDIYDYYQTVYNKLSENLIENLKRNALENAGLFPSKIRTKFNKLNGLVYEAYNIQSRHFSVKTQDLPNGMQKLLEDIDAEFEKLIDLIRDDLHFDNTFIHDFIKEYQKDLKQ